MLKQLTGLFQKSKGRILVADDDYDLCTLISKILATQGYKVDCVRDGQEVVNQVSKKKFDLVVLDIRMPKMDGNQVLEVIRGMPDCKDLGVIMLTAEHMMDAFNRAFKLGAVGYINKPFTPAKLIQEVNAYFATKK